MGLGDGCVVAGHAEGADPRRSVGIGAAREVSGLGVGLAVPQEDIARGDAADPSDEIGVRALLEIEFEGVVREFRGDGRTERKGGGSSGVGEGPFEIGAVGDTVSKHLEDRLFEAAGGFRAGDGDDGGIGGDVSRGDLLVHGHRRQGNGEAFRADEYHELAAGVGGGVRSKGPIGLSPGGTADADVVVVDCAVGSPAVVSEHDLSADRVVNLKRAITRGRGGGEGVTPVEERIA